MRLERYFFNKIVCVSVLVCYIKNKFTILFFLSTKHSQFLDVVGRVYLIIYNI